MTIILPVVLEQLKAQALQQAGIGSIVPGDCKSLAYRISSKTKKQVSDTTLKRVYGFANCRFSPSLFTLNALAEYCDYPDWQSFCYQQKSSGTALSENHRLVLSQLTRKISERTLEILIKGSGIPYPLTVKRKFIADHLADFIAGDQPATLLTAPAGYGKTIGLCQWVQDQLNELLAELNGDNLLFVSSKGMPGMQSGGLDIDGWLKTLLGFGQEESDLSGQLEVKLAAGHRFCLVIDGFDKERFKPGDHELLTDLLLDIIARYRPWPGFKLILTMRSAGWVSLHSRLSTEGLLEDWHLGFMQQQSTDNNMQLLGPDEIAGFCRRLDPLFDYAALSPQVISFFGYPLSLQYYYQQQRNRPGQVKLDQFAVYEAISRYCLDKIYLSRLASAKILLIMALFDKGSLGPGSLKVGKLKFYEELQRFREPYQELLSLGLLREVNQSSQGRFGEYIELPHQRFIAYCLSRRLVYDNDEQYDGKLIQKLQMLDKGYRLGVLKWLVFNTIKLKQLDLFDHLSALALEGAEKAGLLNFICCLMENNYLPADETGSFAYFFGQEGQHIFFYTDIELMGPEHDQLLHELLRLQPPDTARLWIYVNLAISSLLRLDASGTEKCMRKLRKMDGEMFYGYPFHPLDCLETIYNYLAGSIVQTTALMQITAFCFRPLDSSPRPADSLSYLLALNCLKICGNPAKLLRFIHLVERHHLNIRQSDPAFGFFLAVEKAEAYLLCGKVPEARELYLTLRQERGNNKNATTYMTAVLEALRIKILISEGQEPEAGRLLIQFPAVPANSSYRYTELSMIAAYLSSPQDQGAVDLLKQMHYRLMKLTSTGGFCLSRFIQQGQGLAGD